MTDRICGYLLPFGRVLPTPINALVFVEGDAGSRVHVCASHAHVYALLAACPDTEADLRDELRDKLYESRLPTVSAFDPIVVGGWAGGFLVHKLNGDQLNDGNVLAMFTEEVSSLLFLVAPDEEDGDQALLMTMNEEAVYNVWILSSRADVFAHLARVKDLAEPEDYAYTVATFSGSQKLLETDASRPPVQIVGYAAAIITTVCFCLDEQQLNAS